ncbi:MAG: polyprenol monophosphomannose synthase [Hadesarchaea archaeon]|nr:MAG: polyprenol monophosphomannose synthase [Hadesarchaea archaeon]TDA36528.1 MAG: polyprenol monophosphomannose synthase [Hadesarchaea archaeon]
MKASVILPTYNERENLPLLLARIEEVFRKSKILGEVIVVDDNSPDGTGKLAEELKKKYPFLKVIHRREKRGLGSAYLEGYRASKGEIIITMDADLSHDPSYLPELIKAVKKHDLVIGSRYVAGGKVLGWSPYRIAVSRFANLLGRLTIRGSIRDFTSGYRVYRKKAFREIVKGGTKAGGYAFQLEALCRAARMGLKFGEVPITFVNRKHGKSKLKLKEILEFVKISLSFFLQQNRGRASVKAKG